MPVGRFYKPQEAVDRINEVLRTIQNSPPEIEYVYLKRLVEKGQLQKHIPPGRKAQGFFLIEDIEHLAAQLKAFYEGESNDTEPAA